MNRLDAGAIRVLFWVGMAVVSCKIDASSVVSESLVYGKITDGDGNPLGGVQVQALLGGRIEKSAFSMTVDDPSSIEDDTGAYRVFGVPGGDVQIRFTREGFAPKFHSITLAQKNLRLDTTLVPMDGRLKINVQSIIGPQAGAKVIVSHPNYDLASPSASPSRGIEARRASPRTRSTGSDGIVSFDELPADDGFVVTVPDVDLDNDGVGDMEGGKQTANLMKSSPSVARSLNFFLNKKVTYTGTLSVQVYGVSGPVPAATVTLVNSEHGLTTERKTNELGVADFSSLPTTTGYQIYVSPLDTDGDGEFDYEAYIHPINDLNEFGDSPGVASTFALNTYTGTTVKVRLKRAATFRVVYTDIGADDAVAPGDKISILFSHEVEKLSVDEPNQDLFMAADLNRDGSFDCSVDSASSSECIPFKSALDSSPGTKLTIEFVEKPRAGFRYLLDMGFVSSTAGQLLQWDDPTNASLMFWVRSGASKPTSPTIALCSVSALSCSTPVATAINYNTVPDLQWPSVAGALEYRLYAKNSKGVTGWVRLASFAPRYPEGTEFITDSQYTMPSVFLIYPTLPTSIFGGSTSVTYAVTAVSSDGIEGDIDASRALVLSDKVAPLNFGTIMTSTDQSVVPGQDGSKIRASSSSADNTKSTDTGVTPPTDSKKIQVIVRTFLEPMSGSVSIDVIEEGTAGCPASGAANVESLSKPSWVWGPLAMEGVMDITIGSNRDNSGDCLLLKFDGISDASGNRESLTTPTSNPNPTYGFLVCSGDVCIYQLD
ncbi:MAG: carboxypeptidase regulatory-like domain-containing protein [Nitrospirae bacterium]|nr:carboxypeptidase regulatory-like domain-containing protein [Nitrospirota bacterium]